MNTSSYSQMCNRLIGSHLKKKDSIKEKENNILMEKASITMSYKEYLSTTIVTSIITTLVSLVISALLFFILPPMIKMLFLLPFILPFGVLVYYLSCPSLCANRRATSIDRYLPYALNFINTMSETGIDPAGIFKALSNINIFGEIEVEAAKIHKEISVMGIDNITALNNAIERSPSKKFKTFLQGFIGTLQSGSSLPSYLQATVERYMQEDLVQREKNLEFLALIAELFIMGVIAFPLFLVIILSVMGFVGSSNMSVVNILYLLSFLILPALYALFYLLIQSSTMEEIGRHKKDVGNSIKDQYKNNKGQYNMLFVSIGLIIAFQIILLVLNSQGTLQLDLYTYIDIAFLYLLILIGPYSFYSQIKNKQKNEMQERLPDFFTSVSNSLSAGMTIYQAIKIASKGHYGRLTKEIKKMNAEISWNISVREVLQQFVKRMKNPVIKRSVISIDHGLTMGGQTPKIFNAAAKELEQINKVKTQRQANMAMYAVVIFMCYIVFLFIMYTINSTLFTYFFALNDNSGELQGFLNTVDANAMLYALYSFIFIQGFGSGMLGGYLIEGNLSSGARFGFILGLVSIVAFKVLFI